MRKTHVTLKHKSFLRIVNHISEKLMHPVCIYCQESREFFRGKIDCFENLARYYIERERILAMP